MILAVKKVDRLEQLKAELLEVLETSEMDLKKCLFFKSIMAVGQLSTYKDGSVWRKIQANPPKWKCIKPARTQNTKGLKSSIGALKNKIKDCNDIGTLHSIVVVNKDQFLDSDGKPLEVYKEVVKEFRKQKLLLQIKGQRLSKEDNRELKRFKTRQNKPINVSNMFSEKKETILTNILDRNIAKFPKQIAFTEENYNKLYGNGIETPIERVKLGQNQFAKLKAKGREYLIGVIGDVLKDPAIIFKTNDDVKVYVKRYKSESKNRDIVSVVIERNKLNISISTHIEKTMQIAKKMDTILYKKECIRTRQLVSPQV